MTNRATFTLKDDALAYLKQVGGDNKSAYVNRLLLQEKKRSLKKAILQANQEEAEDMRRGWLTELMWKPVKHFRIGVGWNFTDFSDNEFSDNDYSQEGWFLRFQGTF